MKLANLNSGFQVMLMSIVLNQEQQKALDAAGGVPPLVVDPRTHETYVLVSAQEYESVRQVLQEEEHLQAIRKIGLRNAGSRMAEEP